MRITLKIKKGIRVNRVPGAPLREVRSKYVDGQRSRTPVQIGLYMSLGGLSDQLFQEGGP